MLAPCAFGAGTEFPFIKIALIYEYIFTLFCRLYSLVYVPSGGGRSTDDIDCVGMDRHYRRTLWSFEIFRAECPVPQVKSESVFSHFYYLPLVIRIGVHGERLVGIVVLADGLSRFKRADERYVPVL